MERLITNRIKVYGLQLGEFTTERLNIEMNEWMERIDNEMRNELEEQLKKQT